MNIAEWRHPRPVGSLEDLVTNTVRAGSGVGWSVKALLLLKTEFAEVMFCVAAVALALAVFSEVRHLPAMLLCMGVIFALRVALIPSGVNAPFRTSVTVAFGIAALLFLTPPSRSLKQVTQCVLLLSLSLAWSAQSIDGLNRWATITNTYHDELLRAVPKPPELYAGVVFLPEWSTGRESIVALKAKLGLSHRGLLPNVGLSATWPWQAVAIENGFRKVVLCGRNENCESYRNSTVLQTRGDRTRNTALGLYTAQGTRDNFLVMSINFINQ